MEPIEVEAETGTAILLVADRITNIDTYYTHVKRVWGVPFSAIFYRGAIAPRWILAKWNSRTRLTCGLLYLTAVEPVLAPLLWRNNVTPFNIFP